MDPKAHENVHCDEVNHHGVALIACVIVKISKKKSRACGRAWYELVGLPALVAKAAITRDNTVA